MYTSNSRETHLNFQGINEAILMMLNSLEVRDPRTVRGEEDNSREKTQLCVVESKCV
jgi:hypothetical protein